MFHIYTKSIMPTSLKSLHLLFILLVTINLTLLTMSAPQHRRRLHRRSSPSWGDIKYHGLCLDDSQFQMFCYTCGRDISGYYSVYVDCCNGDEPTLLFCIDSLTPNTASSNAA